MGLTGDGVEGVAGLGAAETAPAGGCAGFGGSGALALGLSGSKVGASSGGGSGPTATLVPPRNRAATPGVLEHQARVSTARTLTTESEGSYLASSVRTWSPE